MALLIIAVIVLTAFLAAWMFEFSRPETSSGPARDHSRRALLPAIVAALATAAIAAVAIVLISAARNPPVTIAWTGIRAPAPLAPLEIGGGEHRALTTWPGGGTWPYVRVESPHPQHCLVTTRGGYGFVRSGKVYFNGVAVREGSPPLELAPFWIDLADGHLRIRTGARLPPLLSVELTAPNERWSRSMGQLVALSLYDLRSRGAVRLEVLNRLERWASSIRLIVIDEQTIQVLAPNQPRIGRSRHQSRRRRSGTPASRRLAGGRPRPRAGEARGGQGPPLAILRFRLRMPPPAAGRRTASRRDADVPRHLLPSAEGRRWPEAG